MTSELTKRRIHGTIISLIVFLVEIGLLHTLVALGCAPDDGINASLSMLLTCAAYYALSGFTTLMKKLRISFWIAIAAFMFLCIFVCYSKSWIDVLTFAVCIGLILHSMLILREMMKAAHVYRGIHQNDN